MNTSSKISDASKNEPIISGFTYQIQRGNSFNDAEENSIHQPYSSLNDSFPYHQSNIKNRSYSYKEFSNSIMSFDNDSNNNNNNKNRNSSCNEAFEKSGNGYIKEALRKLQISNPGCGTTSVQEDSKYIGKIKLIPHEHVHSPPKVERTKSVDLEEELSYRKETNLTDAFLKFKQAETDQKEREKMKKEEAKTKRFQRQDGRGKSIFHGSIAEKEKLQRIQELEKQIMRGTAENSFNGEHESLKRERKMNEQAEREFLRQTCKATHNKEVLKRWHSADTSYNTRKYSDDSGMVEEEDASAFELDKSDMEKERKGLNMTEEAFRQFTLKHKAATKFQMGTKRGLNETYSSKSDSFTYIQSPLESTSNKHNETDADDESTLNERLELVEKQVLKFQEMEKKFTKDGRRAAALEAAEGYHVSCLEISRIRKRLLQIQNESKTQRKCSRECKMPSERHQPLVNVSDYNDEGDCVPEGIIQHRLKTFQNSSKHVIQT